MRILFYKWDIFPCEDIIETFRKQGHEVTVPAFPPINHLRDEAFEKKLSAMLQQTPYHFVFSVNYFSTIARVCHNCGVRYASWNVDTPLISMQTPTVYYPENRIFTFDHAEAAEFQAKGVQSIFYLPLAGQPNRRNLQSAPAMEPDCPATTPNRSASEAAAASPQQLPVSFVGSLYEKNRFDELTAILPDYFCGYLDAALEAQQHISGGNIMTEMIPDSVFERIKPYLKAETGYEEYFDASETSKDDLIKLQFNTRVLCHKAAAVTRIRILNQLALQYPVHLFTTSDTSPLIRVRTHPPVDYRTEAPQIFADSKINLNITSPHIPTGVPLRVWDVLSSGGFLLTDDRQDLGGLLQNGRDLVIYHDLPDLLQKVEYYLTHEEERKEIARNGYRQIQQTHNYTNRIQEMLRTL